ncbi:MAG: response regulator [Anaerolinea sp.]|nr:response regulator [Anaerolinea sp.]
MTRQPNILVLEDQASLLKGIRDILEIQGYAVETALNGREGLEKLQNAPIPPDLIVSDIMMPELNGLEFLREVRRVPKWMHIPFVFLTAKGEKSDMRYGFQAGADHYITKPFDPEDLLVIVAAKLKRHQQLVEAQQQQIAEIKKRILIMLHHEFRTPLTTMVGYSDMLNTDVGLLSVNELREYLKEVNSGADRLRRLVENFILLVELETGHALQSYESRKRSMNGLFTILESAVSSTENFANQKGVKVSLKNEAGTCAVITDGDYLRAALVRLIDNAIKFSDKEPREVEAKVSTTENTVIFSITDYGRGIPADEVEKIFEPFYQIDRHVYEDQGAGAGLAIVRRIIEIHGGTITVQSKLGSGSTFNVILPRSG